MSETSLEKVGSGQLELVRKRIVEMLPGMGKVPPGVQLAAAYVTIAYGLDPFMGDLWPIPQKHKGQIVGYALMFGITARQKMAHRSGEYQGRRLRWLTEQEAAHFNVRLDKGDKAIACEVWRKGIEEAFVGYGIVHADDTTRMEHGACAILRAERAALKAAFPVELPPTLAAVDQVDIEDLDAEEEDVIEGEATEVVYPTKEETHTSVKPKVEYRLQQMGLLAEEEQHPNPICPECGDMGWVLTGETPKMLAWVPCSDCVDAGRKIGPKPTVVPRSAVQDLDDLFGPQED